VKPGHWAVATLPETVSVRMRRGSMPKPAAAIVPGWLPVVWPGVDTRHGRSRPKRMLGTCLAYGRLNG
jgi:hypothetical protein